MSDEKKFYPEPSGNFTAGEGSRPGKVEEGDDLRHHTKATLKDYLKNITSKNSYPINHRRDVDPETKELKSLDSELHIAKDSLIYGERVSTQRHEDQEKQPSFLDVNGSSLESREFRKLSDSGQFTDLQNPESGLRDLYDKTERGPGHDLLREVVPSTHLPRGVDEELKVVPANNTAAYLETPESAPAHQKRVSSILLQNNRFTPTGNSPYLADGVYTQFEGSLGSVHASLGVHSMNTPAGNLAVNEMRKVGLELLLRQTGHSVDGDQDGPSLFPGPGFFNTTVGKSTLRARNTKVGDAHLKDRPDIDFSVDEMATFNGPLQEEATSVRRTMRRYFGNGPLEAAEEEHFFSIAEKSFGAGFNHRETFTGNTLAHTTFVTQGLLGLFLSGAVMGIFLELLYGEFEDSRAQGKDPASLPMGSWTDAPEASLVSYGIPYLKYPVFNSIANGILTLFGISSKARPENGSFGWVNNFIFLLAWLGLTIITNLFDFINGISPQKGLMVTLIRNAMRDNDKMNEIFLDPMGFIADLLIQLATAAITGKSKGEILLGIVGMFTQLSGFKFFMTLAVMGDKVYEGEISDFSGIHVPLDQLEDNGQTRIYKSRVNKISNALVWRHRSAPSLMYLPAETFGAMEMMGGTPTAAIAAAVKAGDYEGTEMFRRKVHFDTKNNSHRFHPDDVLSMENQLEAEYMPFYFHDIRTNEIISFHAFISDMKDSYTAEYTDSAGFGRMDPVKIYKRTQRSISVTFYVVSTSQEDFDSMWLSVNKLTQLIYPQYSMGRPVSDDKEGHIMPNSQFMTSSPLIRLRIGDFVRGNGGRFNLAKLFGIQDHEPGALGQSLKTQENITHKKDAKPVKFAKAAIDGMVTNAEAIHTRFVDEAEFKDYGKTAGSEAILKRSATHGYVCKSKPGGFFNADPPLFQVWTRCDALVTIVDIEKRPGAAKDSEKELDEGELNKRVWQVKVKFKDPKDPANPFKDSTDEDKTEYHMFVLPSDLKPVYSAANVEKDAGASAAVDMPQPNDLTKYLSADPENGNPVFKAAQSTRGRGLAGFITSMDFDYSEATYETDSLTRRAPKMVKVSLSFAPIHDIAPGMDHQGGMRAPLYPVGDIMSQLSQDQIRNLADYGFKTLGADPTNYGAPFAPKLKFGESQIEKGKDPQTIFSEAASKVSRKRFK